MIDLIGQAGFDPLPFDTDANGLLSLKLQHVATTMADLASRDEQLSLAAVQSMFSAAQHIVNPFDIANVKDAILAALATPSDQRRRTMRRLARSVHHHDAAWCSRRGAAVNLVQ